MSQATPEPDQSRLLGIGDLNVPVDAIPTSLYGALAAAKTSTDSEIPLLTAAAVLLTLTTWR